MIVFPPTKFATRADVERIAGDGFAFTPAAPGGAMVTVWRWTNALEQFLRETPVTRMYVDEGWDEPSIIHLLPNGSIVEEVFLASAAVNDFSALLGVPRLRKLAVIKGCERVPFSGLASLRHCVIHGDSLGRVHEAPLLKHLHLIRTEGVDLRPLAALTNLEHLWIAGVFGAFKLDGIERLSLNRVDVRQVPRLESFKPLRQLPLRHLHVECSARVADVEVIGELTHLETLHLEQAGTPRSYAFLSSLDALERLEIERTRTADTPSIAALIPLRRLRTLTLGAERGELRDLHDLSLLGEMVSLQSFRMYGGPKQIESIHWINQLRELESFDMFGTEIGDGDLTPLLESESLRRIRLNPVRKRYSHSEAEVYAILRAKALTTEHPRVG